MLIVCWCRKEEVTVSSSRSTICHTGENDIIVMKNSFYSSDNSSTPLKKSLIDIIHPKMNIVIYSPNLTALFQKYIWRYYKQHWTPLTSTVRMKRYWDISPNIFLKKVRKPCRFRMSASKHGQLSFLYANIILSSVYIIIIINLLLCVI